MTRLVNGRRNSRDWRRLVSSRIGIASPHTVTIIQESTPQETCIQFSVPNKLRLPVRSHSGSRVLTAPCDSYSARATEFPKKTSVVTESDPPRQQSRHGDDKPGFAPEGAESVFRVRSHPCRSDDRTISRRRAILDHTLGVSRGLYDTARGLFGALRLLF